MNKPINDNKNSDRYNRAFRLVIKHYWRETKSTWKTSLPAFLIPAIGSILVFYIPPLALAKILEQAANDQSFNINESYFYVLLFAGAWLAGEILWRIGTVFIIHYQIKVVDKLYNKALNNLLERDLNFFHDNFAGSLTKRTIAYANRFIDASDILIYNTFASLIPTVFAAVVLWFYSPWLMLCLVGWLTVIICIIWPLIQKRRALVTVRETASNVVTGHVADVYGNIDAVRAHSTEKQEEKRHSLLVKDYTNKIKHTWDFQNKKIDLIVSPLYVATNASGLLISIHLVREGAIPLAALIVVFAYYERVTRFLWEFNGIYRRLESALSDAAQYTELLLTEPAIHDPSTPQQIEKVKGKVEFDRVHFQYEEDSAQLFESFSLKITPGEKIGLVGRSGGGKSSITKLLMRFADVDTGSIRIDGVNVKDMTQKYLRSLIAYVPQDPAMFHRSIHENIAYGKPNASRDDVIAAAKKAHAHEFIKDLPKGYETLVGERGIKLSGGQRQRVAIARAILKDSPILLLDEATSALDSESESLIQDALRKLMNDKTAIVIAHRLSTIQKMDRILVLDQGEIIEEGSHASLVEQNGIYCELWQHQSGGFLED